MRTERQERPADDPLARGSFTFRRMRPWQIWALGIIAVGGFAAAVIFA